jgi:epoxyqueuosine reductase
MAVFTPPMSLKIHFQDKIHQTMLPGNYSFTGINNDTLEEEVINNIIKKQGYSVKRTRNKHLKLLAVRSGLGKYGRNNICYVGEMGSFVNLMAFFTDYEFEEDTLGTIEMMESCKSCQICISDCPGQAIPKSERFIINIERCIPLYNEIPEKIPEWIPSSAHNALMGCMICQKNCPGNKKALPLITQGGDILEEETKVVLDCNLEKAKELNLGEKIPIYFFNPEITLPGLDLLKRNLEFILTQ